MIIVNWNSKEFVRKCLISLHRQCAKLDLEIIVVDNGSFDGCREILAANFPEVIFLQLEHNVGFGRANNVGFNRATAAFIWLLNPDTEVIGDAASALLTALRSQKDIGLVGAKLLNSDGSLQTTCVQSLPTAFNQVLDSEALRRRLGIWGMEALRSQSKPIDVEAIPGACMMMRRSDFSRVGCFDPRYFMYCEDMDLCFSIRKRGLRILYVPDAVVLHHGGRSANQQVNKFSLVMMREALMSYLLKNSGVMTAWFYRLALAMSAIVRIIVLFILRAAGWPSQERISDSLRKWVITLSWCVGRERWAKSFSRT